MSFLNPFGLLGLLTLPLIAWLHLRHERGNRMVVSSTRLWNFLDEQIQGQRARKLPMTLHLLVDLLIAFCLSLAVAQPQIPWVTTQSPAQHVVVLLDTSTSMQAVDVSPSRFSAAQQDAMILLNNARGEDVVTVISIGGEVEIVGDSRSTSMVEVRHRLANLGAEGVGLSLQEGVALAGLVQQSRMPQVVHVFTDGAFTPVSPSSLDEVVWHMFAGEGENQGLVNVSLEVEDDNLIELFAQVLNGSPTQAQRTVQVYLDGVLNSEILVDIPALGAVDLDFDIRQPVEKIHVVLTGEDAYVLDDVISITLPERATFAVGFPEGQTDPRTEFIVKALKAAGVEEANITSGGEFDLGIYFDKLPEYLPSAPMLLIVENENELIISSEADGIMAGVHYLGEEPGAITGEANGQVFHALVGTLNQQTAVDPTFPIFMKNMVDWARQPGQQVLFTMGAEDFETTLAAAHDDESMISLRTALVSAPVTDAAEVVQETVLNLTPYLLIAGLWLLLLEVIWAWR